MSYGRSRYGDDGQYGKEDCVLDLTQPYVVSEDPPPGTIDVEVDYVPAFDLVDDDSSINELATKIWLNGDLIYSEGVSYFGYDIYATPVTLGYHYDLYHPSIDLPGNTVITIRVYGEDLASTPNSVDTSWNFVTWVWPDPYIVNKSPEPNEEDVHKDSDIEFTIMDDYKQIVRSSIKVWVRGVLVFNAGAFLKGWSASRYGVSGIGFWFHVTPDPVLRWIAEEEISIRVYAENTELKEVDDTWKFITRIRPFTFKIYPMIVDGLRKADTESD